MSQPIFIPTKGRARRCKTAELLRSQLVEFNLVVEPQDADDYAKEYGLSNLMVLPKNDQGLVYARNYIKTEAIKSGADWHWQLDDDIRWFNHRS